MILRVLPNSLLSLIYPQECRVCFGPVDDHSDGVACRECWANTRIFDGSEMLCEKCGAFFDDKAAPAAVYCHQCDDHFYDKAFAVGIYENALAASIVHLKNAPSMPRRVRSLITSSEKLSELDGIDLIIPIPLSRLRQRERGFNQAEIVAKVAGRVQNVQIDIKSLARRSHTPVHRIGMDRKARALTVKGAFEVTRPQLIKGKNILLVDDVFTSGATASACARALKKNGAGTVNVFTLARAVMN